MRSQESLCKVVLKSLICKPFHLCLCKCHPCTVLRGNWVTFAPASVLSSPFFEAPVSVLDEQAAVPQFTYVCAIIFCTFLFINFVSITPNFFCNKKNFFLHSFNFRSNNILFMWLILYFLILFISYCSVQYYSSSIYRYILVKKEHDVDHLGKFYVKRRAFIVFWNINCEMGFFNFIILFLFLFFPITGNSKFGNF